MDGMSICILSAARIPSPLWIWQDQYPEDLVRLENDGVEMYDAQSQEKVLVVAPLMLIICTCL